MSGGAIVMVSEKIIAKGKKLAAHHAGSGGSRHGIQGRPLRHRRHRPRHRHPRGGEGGVRAGQAAARAWSPACTRPRPIARTSGNFPNGAHVCEVEIDPDTGATEIVGYWVVDDVGTVINPMLVKGQIMGGIAQGIGQVLMEDKAYDPQTGQVLAGSFMDYAMPRARQLLRGDDRGQSGADADQSARRQGRGRGRHGRLAVGRRRTPSSMRCRSTASATSTRRARPSRCGRRSQARRRKAGSIFESSASRSRRRYTDHLIV